MKKIGVLIVFVFITSCMSFNSDQYSDSYRNYEPKVPGKADFQTDGYTIETHTDPLRKITKQDKIYIFSVYQMYFGSDLKNAQSMKKKSGLNLYPEIDTNAYIKYALDYLSANGYNVELYSPDTVIDDTITNYYLSIDYAIYNQKLSDYVNDKVYTIPKQCLYYYLDFYDKRSGEGKIVWSGFLTKMNFKTEGKELSDVLLSHFLINDISGEDVLPSWYSNY